MSIIINVEELLEKNRNNENHFAIIDVRTKSEQFDSGYEAYKDSHLPEAVFLDFKTDLSGEESFLPHVETLAKKLGDLGIDNECPIILYDQGNHRFASKAWFVLSYLGHDKVYILNGGIKSWLDAGHKLTSNIPNFTSVTYQARTTLYLIV